MCNSYHADLGWSVISVCQSKVACLVAVWNKKQEATQSKRPEWSKWASQANQVGHKQSRLAMTCNINLYQAVPGSTSCASHAVEGESIDDCAGAAPMLKSWFATMETGRSDLFCEWLWCLRVSNFSVRWSFNFMVAFSGLCRYYLWRASREGKTLKNQSKKVPQKSQTSLLLKFVSQTWRY